MGGTKANGHVAPPFSYETMCSSVTRRSFLQDLFHTIKSAVPFLIFLTMYAFNKVLHILPLLQDLGCVHIHTLNAIEEFLFGCHPHRIVASYHNVVLDFLSAIPYLVHYWIPIVFPAYLLIRGQMEEIPKFYWLLGWVMWVNYFLWMVFPHTPPWVVDNLAKYNATAMPVLSMHHREGCAFARLDKLTGLPLFYKMFSGNPVPYASFPSGHVAWPLVVHLSRPPGGNYFLIYVFWMAWATLYSCHHYILDVVGSVVMVILSKKVVDYLSDKQVCTSDYKCKAITIACPFHV